MKIVIAVIIYSSWSIVGHVIRNNAGGETEKKNAFNKQYHPKDFPTTTGHKILHDYLYLLLPKQLKNSFIRM